MSCPYAVDVTFSFSKTIMMFDVFHYIQILEILRRNVSVPVYKLNTRWSHAYVDMTFSFSKIIMLFNVFHYIQICDLHYLWSVKSIIFYFNFKI